MFLIYTLSARYVRLEKWGGKIYFVVHNFCRKLVKQFLTKSQMSISKYLKF